VGCEATLLNQKFLKSLLSTAEGIKKLLALIKTYFDHYAYQIQVNILNPEELIEAKKHPERYRDLVVRVAGYSAYFVELSPEVQDEIIARTTHSQWA
jgi:pyruvate-formate lyase